jgi:hypothetical protein
MESLYTFPDVLLRIVLVFDFHVGLVILLGAGSAAGYVAPETAPSETP